MKRATIDFWSTKLGGLVDSLEDTGAHIWVWGLNEDQTQALVIGPNDVTVANVDQDHIGVFHCRRATFNEDNHYQDDAANRFPILIQ